MGEQIAGFGTRTVLLFHHLHTNEVQELAILCEADAGKKLYRVKIKGKPRPMLLLWQRGDGAFQVLLMTSSATRDPRECQVKVKEGSYVDCSRIFEYSKELLVSRNDRGPENRPEKLNYQAWKDVLDRLPEHAKRSITLYGMRCALSARY